MSDAERLLADVAIQPDAFERLADRYGDPDGPLGAVPRLAPGERIRFIGVGSSAYGCLSVVPTLRARGVDAAVESPDGETGARPDRGLVAVLVSASGRSPETLAAARRHAGLSRTVALTNDPASPLAALCDVVLPLCAGQERAGVATRTFRATVAVSRLLANVITGVPPDVAATRAAAEATDALLRSSHAGWLDDALATLDGAATISIAAPARHVGSALQAALLFRECPRIPAGGYDTLEWSHVGLYLTIFEDHRTVVFTTGEGERGITRWTSQRNVPVLSVGRPLGDGRSAVPAPDRPPLDALVATVVTDVLAARLWAERGGSRPADA